MEKSPAKIELPSHLLASSNNHASRKPKITTLEVMEYINDHEICSIKGKFSVKNFPSATSELNTEVQFRNSRCETNDTNAETLTTSPTMAIRAEDAAIEEERENIRSDKEFSLPLTG